MILKLSWTGSLGCQYSLSLQPSSSRACSCSSQIPFSCWFSSCRRWNSCKTKHALDDTSHILDGSRHNALINTVSLSLSVSLCLSLSVSHSVSHSLSLTLTFLSPLICNASALSWLTESLSLSRSFCNVWRHSFSIFRSVSSCCLREQKTTPTLGHFTISSE